MKAIIAALIGAVSIAACAAPTPAGSRQTLVGSIHIKGNEPFPTVVIETDDHAVWELIGVSLDEARSLANRRVVAKGTVERAPGPDNWRPTLKVDAIPQPADR